MRQPLPLYLHPAKIRLSPSLSAKAFPVGNTFTIGEKTLATGEDGIGLTQRLDDLTDGTVTLKINHSETDKDIYVVDFSDVAR